MNNKPIRVLQVIGEMNCGGAEMLLMNLHRHIDRNIIQFDYVVHTTNEGMYDNEILYLGGIIYHCPKFNGKNIVKYKKWWRDFLNVHPEYRIIHGHIGSSAAVYLNEGKKRGLFTIAHSHATRDTDKSVKSLLWNCFSYPTRYISDFYMACSEEAGFDRYGKRIVESEKFSVLKNAIDCNQFSFSLARREEMRKQLNVENCFVVGHVGRFSTPKNHAFLIDIFCELKKKCENSKLVLLGTGPLENNIHEKCNSLNIEEDVIFAGVHKNTEDYYQTMDVFCFPSLFEGLGIAAVEAQTSGLNVVASDAVPALADIGAGLFERISLKASPSEWASVLLEKKELMREKDAVSESKKAGYDISVEAKKLQTFYLEHWR